MFPRGFTNISWEFILVRPINIKVCLTKQPQTNPVKLIIGCWFRSNVNADKNIHLSSNIQLSFVYSTTLNINKKCGLLVLMLLVERSNGWI